MMARAHSPQFYCSFSQPCLAVRSPPRAVRRNQHLLSPSVLSRAYSSLSLSPSRPSLFPIPLPFSSATLHRTSLLFHRSSSFSLPAPFFFFFSPPDTIQGSSSGGRPDANRRKKEREREDRGTVMPRACICARDGIYRLQKRERVSPRAVSIATLVRSFVCEMSRPRQVGVSWNEVRLLLRDIRVSSAAAETTGRVSRSVRKMRIVSSPPPSV